ncbi:D-lactate dehydrogenase [Izhakiella capsodis]|uniref:Quinone-dependent D-lactate dehydrogenase n=1 Tax=Izhakiella capsodis TaxID=1367852 RepID=A0A1I4UH09_9GAMM|nr:D-lactate dehydrogenase [Izhakiella capsodis]SFM88226.1 D-lactate dehydrogenase [Izhakiella capsodis]
MESTVTPENRRLIATLARIVGKGNLLTDSRKTERYRKGFRSGSGEALAVAFPGSLLEQWRLLQACVDAEIMVIMQAANTGLTEGSTPSGNDYERPVVIISTLRLNQVQLLDGGKQVLAFPGSTLYQLEKILRPLGREPHSVIGSSCIGASVVGGVCNNSGGALIKRGPAWTEMALYARIDEQGKLALVNHLGIRLGASPEQILMRLDDETWRPEDVDHDERHASDNEYATRVRDVDADTPSRFNADARRLFEASGCAGKLAVFAVRLDTFVAEPEQQVFYIGTNNTEMLTNLRRQILTEFTHLPVAGEYLHRDMFDIAEKYGKDTFLMIDKLGTDRMPLFFTLKGRAEALLSKLSFVAPNVIDRLLQRMSGWFPAHLPTRMTQYRHRFEHHLMLKMSGEGVEEARRFLSGFFAEGDGAFFTCTAEEGRKAFLHRFAAAGAAVRYHAVHQDDVSEILALDIALRRNDNNWFEQLPAEFDDMLIHRLYYGHFFCYVFHQDYIVRKGVDVHVLKEKMLALLRQRGAQYPAEHNVGHLYEAQPQLKAFYQQLDPTNSFNPGIGKTSKKRFWH